MLEGYITPWLMSYIDRYVKNIKPSDLRLSFWGGDAILRNLELRLDVLERELRYPVQFRSGRIQELLLHIPWNAIVSRPVEVVVKDIEFVIKLKDVRSTGVPPEGTDADPRKENTSTASGSEGSGQAKGEEQAPKGYTSRIAHNVIYHLQNVVVKVVEEQTDMMITFNIGTIDFYATDEHWERMFMYVDYFHGDYSLHKVLEVRDMVVNLQPIDNSVGVLAGEGRPEHAPFVQRCSFTVRFRYDYKSNVPAKTTTNVFFEGIDFSADERQFCLFNHFIDWLLAVYYSSKRLKGRDDKLPSPRKPQRSPVNSECEPPSSAEQLAGSYVVVSEEQVGEPAEQAKPDEQGWGSWMWSYVAAEPQPTDDPEDTSGDAATHPNLPSLPETSFAIFSKSLSVTLKVTHSTQVPVFYSPRSFTRPVLRVNFTGCVFQLDTAPATKLFLVSLGIMSVEASLLGVCACAKKPLSAWRAGRTVQDGREQMPVFSLGMSSTPPDPEGILRGTLFGRKVVSGSEEEGAETLMLDEKRKWGVEDYKGVWFTYEYYDIAPGQRVVEECEERLEVGRVEGVICPDSLHCLQHFRQAYNQSLEANPLFSEGMVVIGDPKAETVVKVRFAGGHICLTSSIHYLHPHTVSTADRSKRPHKHSQASLRPILPSVSVSVGGASISITKAMYNGNASLEHPQRHQLRLRVTEVQAGTADTQGVEQMFRGGGGGGGVQQFLSLPVVELNKHSKTTDSETDTSYFQLDLDEVSATVSLHQLAKLFFIYASWKAAPLHPQRAKFSSPPSLTTASLGHLHILLRHATLTQSTTDDHSLLSVVLGGFSGGVVKDSTAERARGSFVPVLHGPVATQYWNTAEVYSQSQTGTPQPTGHGQLLEVFIARPAPKCEAESFPALQLTVAGFVVCLDPSLLAFLHHLPLGMLRPPPEGDPPTSSHHGTSSTASHSPTATPTPSVITEEEVGGTQERVNVLDILKVYAAKVLVNPVLLVVPTESFEEVDFSTESFADLPDFPILPSLLSSPHPSTLILTLPTLTLQSARSHVLDEPVPRYGRLDTFPWDCSLRGFSLFTVARGRGRYILEPLEVKATLASQQGGPAITIHSEAVALALSHKQASLVNEVAVTLSTSLSPFLTSSPSPEDAQDSGMFTASAHTPSLPSSPAHSTVTAPTLLTIGSGSHTSSFLPQGFLSLWVQVIVTKITFSLYDRDSSLPPPPPHQPDLLRRTSNSSSDYGTPLTSPSLHCPDDLSPSLQDGQLLTRLRVEIDGTSVQVDIQERSTEVVLKVAAVDGSYCVREGTGESVQWKGYLQSDKLFSSRSSALPSDLAVVVNQSTSPASSSFLHPLLTSTKHHSFIVLESHLPRTQAHKPPTVHLNIQPFEVIVWLPAVNSIISIISTLVAPPTEDTGPTDLPYMSSATGRPSHTDSASWPAVELTMECFRVVLPSRDFSSSLLLNVGALQVTSTLSYPTSELRYVLSNSAFRRLSLLSSERKQPPLPAYQLESYCLSLWGLRRNDLLQSTQVLLYASNVDLRVLYTPAIYWTPHIAPGPALSKTKAAVLACGHSVEASLTTDVTIAIGVEQVACLADVLATNTLPPAREGRTEPQQMSGGHVPTKLLLTGQTVTLVLLAEMTEVEDGDMFNNVLEQSDPRLSSDMLHSTIGEAMPLLQASLFNPLFSKQTGATDSSWEVSCFRTSVSSTENPIPIAYQDLLDPPSLLAVLPSPLLETRRGQTSETSRVPLNFLTVKCTHQTSEESPGLLVELGRPVRVCCSPRLLKEILKTVKDITAAFQERRGAVGGDAGEGEVGGGTEKEVGGVTRNGPAVSLNLSTSQVLVELQLDTFPASVEAMQHENSHQSLLFHVPVSTATREGVLLAWDDCTVVYPHSNSRGVRLPPCIAGDVHISGLQLLTVVGGATTPVAPPTMVSCCLSQYLPCSELDTSQVAVNITIGLLDVHISQYSVRLLKEAISSLSETLTSPELGDETAEVACKEEDKDVTVHFTDDLRTGEFKYITDSSDTPELPLPGEVVFHLGSTQSPASMSWQYHEPRAITKLLLLPVPFSVTTEEDVPVDIKVACTLEYWNEESETFHALESFHMSESVSVEISPAHPISSRRWRIAINEVEWVDEEDGEIFVTQANVLDDSGSAAPLSSLLSPLSLAASAKVDSHFSHHFIPSWTVAVHCQEVRVTLRHSASASEPVFRGYKVCQYSTEPQDLVGVKVAGLGCHMRHLRHNLTAQLDGQVSVEYVDFRDQTWRTVLHPTSIHTKISSGHSTTTAPLPTVHPVATRPQSQLSVDMKAAPGVLRVSQGLVHTASLTADVWRTKEGEETKAATIFNHYTVCNDTLEDLHFGQISTDEVILLPSNSCCGYSWRNYKTVEQLVHVCLVVGGQWRWSRPFSIDGCGLKVVQLYVGTHAATLHVRVADIGGLQKMVTLIGGWQFSSLLPFPLEVQVVGCDVHNPPPQYRPPSLPKITLPPSGGDVHTPSLLAADSHVAGVKMRMVEEGGEGVWSNVYPLTSTTHGGWNKPQLLAEVSSMSGQTIHFWFNIRPMELIQQQPSRGSMITLAPLFSLFNHLPFDLNLSLTVGSATSGRSLPGGVAKGKGSETLLWELSADTWHYVKFRESESVPVSEPAVPVSTFLLLQLPFSTHDNDAEEGEKAWPYSMAEVESLASHTPPPTTTTVTLPVEGGHYLSLSVTLLRSHANTIAVHLQPSALLVNSFPLPLWVTEGSLREDGTGRSAPLDVAKVATVLGSEFSLSAEWKGHVLESVPLHLPLATALGTTESVQGNNQTVPVFLRSEEKDGEMVAELLLTFHHQPRTLVATIKPSYIVHNNTSMELAVWSCLLKDTPRRDLRATCLQTILPEQSRELTFWQKVSSVSGGEHSIAFHCTSEEEAETDLPWSIWLSPNYVRRSFSLPTLSPSPTPAHTPALLTMHEANGMTYLVVSSDPAPRIQFQNLCGTPIEVVETSTTGIHAVPELIAPGELVVYEPPSIAELYPLVYDEELSSNRDKELLKSRKQVSIRLRAHGDVEEGEYEWSPPFTLSQNEDRVIDIPAMGSVLLTSLVRGASTILTLIPTGGSSPSHPQPSTSSEPTSARRDLKFGITLSQLVLCLDTESSDSRTVTEVLRVVANDACISYASFDREGTNFKTTVQSLHIDNMLESSTSEYAVVLLPRVEHARRPSLIESETPPLVSFSLQYSPHSPNMIEKLHVSVQPVTVHLEDSLLHTLREVFGTYSLPGVLQPVELRRGSEGASTNLQLPEVVRHEAKRDITPLVISSLVIESVSFYLNARISLKVLLSCSDSPFHFRRYQVENVYSNWTEISQTVSARYVTATFMHIGWLLGSLELIGSPASFLQSVGRGLRDLVTLPYEGLTRSPALFILGIGHGTTAFLRHFSGGALRSVTNLASSLSQNMERLSMDPEHVSYQVQQRRDHPVTHFVSGVTTGISSFGLSLMSAVAGIVEQPMQSVHQLDDSTSLLGATRGVLAGVGKGLVGAVTKPVGGAMELVSQTGQGIMHGTGLAQRLTHKAIELNECVGPIDRAVLPPTITRCAAKVSPDSSLLAAVEVTHVNSTGTRQPSILLLAMDRLYLMNCESDTVTHNLLLTECNVVEKGGTLLDEVELQLVPVVHQETGASKDCMPKFEVVEHYLQLSEAASPAQLATEITWTDVPPMGGGGGGGGEGGGGGGGGEGGDGGGGNVKPQQNSAGVILLANTHHALQLLSIFHSLQLSTLHPDSAFSVYTSPAKHSESFFTARSTSTVM